MWHKHSILYGVVFFTVSFFPHAVLLGSSEFAERDFARQNRQAGGGCETKEREDNRQIVRKEWSRRIQLFLQRGEERGNIFLHAAEPVKPRTPQISKIVNVKAEGLLTVPRGIKEPPKKRGLRFAEVLGRVQERIEEIRKTYNLPALSAAIIANNSMTQYISGYRKAGDPTLASHSDSFHIGSCTKAMTATLLAIYIERGRLSWGQTLGELFPEIQNLQPSFKSVSIEYLACHRAGFLGELSDFKEGEPYEKLWAQKDVMKARAYITEELLSTPPAYPPGKKYAYGNGAYIIIGRILEKITGSSWEDLMRRELFEPLEMKGCGFGIPVDLSIDSPKHLWPHVYEGGRLVPVKDPSLDTDIPAALGPAGTVRAPISEWAKFIECHMDGFNGKATPILKPESFKKLHQDIWNQGYTFGGWGTCSTLWGGETTLNHYGTNLSNYACLFVGPVHNIAVLGVTNVGGEKPKSPYDPMILEKPQKAIQAVMDLLLREYGWSCH